MATKEVGDLLGGKFFDFPKPTGLIKKILDIATEKDSLVIDFFSGSGTTAHSVLHQNMIDSGTRRFILVQLPEPCDEKTEAAKAGYSTIWKSARNASAVPARKSSPRLKRRMRN